MTVSIVIPTHNRKEDLRRTCEALDALRPRAAEVIVCADACTDGTAEYLRSHHPGYRLLANETSLGSIASRDTMIRMAAGDIVLSLDDDSHPCEPDFLARLEEIFAANPRLAVATFPQRSDEFPESLSARDFGPPAFFGSFTSSGAAIRRSVFIEVGGYPVHFRHAYRGARFRAAGVGRGLPGEMRERPSASGTTIRRRSATKTGRTGSTQGTSSGASSFAAGCRSFSPWGCSGP